MDRFSWHAAPFSWGLAQELAGALHIPLLAGIILARRGFADVEQARAFLAIDDRVPDPFLMEGMEAAVALLSRALDARRRIVVHGDYDVDGVSATALLVRALSARGAPVEPYLPSRFVQGYGLSAQAVEEIAAGGDGLLVTVDCGVNYPDEVARARALGLDVIVTDHHRPGDVLPDCPVVHPALGGYPEPDLCGAGVAFKLLHGLLMAREDAVADCVPEALQEHLDLVALGTVADLVPLRGENRLYVREGLVRLNATTKPGLQALARVAGCDGDIDAGSVGFRLGPRLNAAGRLGDPQAPLRLLLTEDEGEASRLANELDGLNRQRREVEGRITAEAVGQVEALDELPTALVLSGEEWHEGVVGIVASRLVERFHRPTVLLALTDGKAKGSARSIPAYDLMTGLRACDPYLLVYGGHRQAAGMTLARERVDEFRQALTAHAAASLSEADLTPVYRPDAVVRGQDLSLETVDALTALAPFGMGNAAPRLLALGARLDGSQLTRTGDHLRCTLVLDGVQAKGIGFGLGPALAHLRESAFLCHAGLSLEADEWQGRARTQVRLHSLYSAASLGVETLGCGPECPFLDPLDAPPSCPRCSDPYGEVREALPLPGRDLRDQPGSLSAVAQVLSSGESAAVLGVSVIDRLRLVAGGLPLLNLGVGGVDCVSRHCWREHGTPRPEALLVLDWQAAERRPGLLAEKRHVLVMDPPFRPGHTAMLRDLASRGAQIHLVYGAEERASAARHCRSMLHPRFWMVPLYRAWRDGLAGLEAWQAVRRSVWQEHQVLPEADDLRRAEAWLRELGHAPAGTGAATGAATAIPGEATIDLARLPGYGDAERAYEQAVRLCQIM